MPKYEKPGKKIKHAKIINTRSRVHKIEKPKDEYCRFCGAPNDGTCYFHHCEIPYLKLKYGKGMGRKVDDNLSVWGHFACGEKMSNLPENKYIKEWENKWLMAIVETWLV